MPKSLHPWSVQFHADTVVHIVSNSWNCCCKDRCCLFIYFGSREQVNDIILGCKTTCKISKVLGKDDQGKPIHGRAKFPQLKTPSDAVKRVTDFVTESTARQLNATPAQHTGSGGDGGSHRVFRCTAGIGCVQESHRGKGHCGPALTRQPARAGALLHCSGLMVASCFARECFLRLPYTVHRFFSPTDALSRPGSDSRWVAAHSGNRLCPGKLQIEGKGIAGTLSPVRERCCIAGASCFARDFC